jgi:hypothetical protein
MNFRTFLVIVLAAIYIGGCVQLNGEVRKACTHGNCKHGAYSKYNRKEKLTYGIWALGVPAAAYALWKLLRAKPPSLHIPPPTVQLPTSPPLTHPSLQISSLGPRRRNTRNSLDRDNLLCPVCGGEMVIRIAKRGRNRGNKFYGCRAFPNCRGTVNIKDIMENPL